MAGFLVGVDEHSEFLLKAQIHDAIRTIGGNCPHSLFIACSPQADALLASKFASKNDNRETGWINAGHNTKS